MIKLKSDLRLIRTFLGNSWYDRLSGVGGIAMLRDLFHLILNRKRDKTVRVYPLSTQCLKAFQSTPYNKVKIVILGQDPYDYDFRNQPVAHGLAFSSGVTNFIPPSLRNIIKVSNKKFPNNGDLSDWARQGVLLLNTALTVEGGKRNCHSLMWRPFIHKVIELLNEKENVIYMLWGNSAKSFKPFINEKHKILETSHPSPLSAHRGFLESDHFNKANYLLKHTNQKEIKW